MTPLAQQIVKQSTMRASDRVFDDRSELMPRMGDIHCFELSEPWCLVKLLAEKLHDSSIGADGRYLQRAEDLDERFTFLPAPKTWIEWTGDTAAQRTGVLLETPEIGAEGLALCTLALQYKDTGHFGSFYQFALPLHGSQHFGQFRTADCEWPTKQQQINIIFDSYAALALINTPKIIGRRQHMPHRGLERRLISAFGAGQFPLHAWTEIKLEVAKPIEIDTGEAHEAHLTGRKALHFCRAHIRIKRGKLEYVSSHWRGDPALGIKQSRYRAVLPTRNLQ